MKKLITTAAPLAMVAGLAVGAAGLSLASGPATSDPCAPTRVRGVAADPSRLDAGGSVGAADGEAIQLLGAGGAARVAALDGIGGVVRHVATRAGIGTAYVRDRAGGDVVVAVSADGTVRLFPAGGEALHPSWSRSGDLVWAVGAGLRVVPSGGSRARAVTGPLRGGLAFSPLFHGSNAIVAGVASAPSSAVPEDEYLSNLWRYDRRARTWRQLTRFTAGTDRWSIVRTPVAAPDGSIEFVRVSGRASQDTAPRFELWRLTGSGPQLERVLPGERYLAGHIGGARVWNVLDGDPGGWRLAEEMTGGSLRDVGCGAVAVDPLDQVDPDVRAGHRFAPLSGPNAGPAPSPASPIAATNAIIVGDFSTAQSAIDAAARIATVTGLHTGITDALQQPALVRPGVSAVLVTLPSGQDPEQALSGFRSELPEFAGWSWLVAV